MRWSLRDKCGSAFVRDVPGMSKLNVNSSSSFAREDALHASVGEMTFP